MFRYILIGAKITIFDQYLGLRSVTAKVSSKVITLSGGICVSLRQTEDEVPASVNLVYDSKPGRRCLSVDGYRPKTTDRT